MAMKILATETNDCMLLDLQIYPIQPKNYYNLRIIVP